MGSKTKSNDHDAQSDRPWYSADRSQGSSLSKSVQDAVRHARDLTDDPSSCLSAAARTLDGLLCLTTAIIAGVCLALAIMGSPSLGSRLGYGLLAALSTLAACYFLMRQLGLITKLLLPESLGNGSGVSNLAGANLAAANLTAASSQGRPLPRRRKFQLGWQALTGQLSGADTRKSLPAPEMVLQQFVHQVKAYAAEKSYQKAKNPPASDRRVQLGPEPVDLLRRRWNEVLDSLNEFEIYLAGDQRAMIETLVARHPSTLLDVSQIFREVAESFDTSWRRKGINIESAIVTPLKATTSEPILRRILVGPWRTCAYLARRGNGVVFSAQSQSGKVVARWECEGLSVPEDFQQIALDNTRSVNERIEAGMELMGVDPQNGNTLFALVSLVTWIDLAKATNTQFSFKNTNDGFVISLELS